MSGESVAVDSADSWPEDADDVAEGIVSNWFVRVGTEVTSGEVLGEIQIEKVSVDVVAPSDGTVNEILVGQGEEFARGDELVRLRPAE